MVPNKLLVAALVLYSGVTFAQGTRQSAPRRTSAGVATATGTSRGPVATQPSNNPFKDPIGQGVPPAASVNTNLNSNRTNVPLRR
jgi:hypothetical protein